MTDLVARLREAIDAEQQDVELSISNEIESLRADGGIVMTREEILTYDAEEEGGGPYMRRLRRCAADRKILDLWDDTVEVRDIAWDKFRAGEMPTKSESTHATHAERELAALQVVLEALAEAYGVEA